MKKNILLPLIPLFILAGCTNGGSNQNSTKTVYSDKASVVDGNITISFTGLNEYKGFGSETYSVSFTLNLLSSNPKPVEYKIATPKFIRESNSAEYSVNMLIMDPITLSLECDIAKTYSFSTTLPTSIASENYYFTFKGNDVTYKYCLYETPDELRADRKVEYYISNKLVNTVTVKHKRKLTSYVYEGSDNLTYCEKWCLDSNRKTGVGSITITEDIKLYGASESNLKWSYDNSTLNGVNHVPSNGILLLPETTAGKQYSIGNYAIKDITVKKIYIPKTITKIYGGNFTGIGSAIICFEGTEQEWKDLFYLSSNIVTKNVVYNSKYTGK